MRFNWLYATGLNYLYRRSLRRTHPAVAGIRGLDIRQAGVSMQAGRHPAHRRPRPSAERINAVNTIVNTDSELVGYNTDYVAVASAALT